MKQKCMIVMLVLLVVMVVATIAKKDAQQQKHNQEKVGKKPFSTHREGGSKSEHHAIKEVIKHAPHTLNHHEAKTQLDLGHNNKKRVQPALATADLKLQDLSLEDHVHHKVESEKVHEKHFPSAAVNGRGAHKPVHNKQHQHMVPPKGPNNSKLGVRNENWIGSSDKKEKKAAKKVLMGKNKKYKRAKRLHKFIW